MSMVLDCSVTLAWFLPDEQSAFALKALETAGSDGATVPFHWYAEMANGLLMALKRERISEDAVDQVFSALAKLPLKIERGSFGRVDADLVIFAKQSGLTVYDALYLDCARRLRLPLATFDKALALAAKSADVPLLGPFK